jgi:predicted transcriptional regulator
VRGVRQTRTAMVQKRVYHPSDEEWFAIKEGLDQAKRGEFVSEKEMDEFWKRPLE